MGWCGYMCEMKEVGKMERLISPTCTACTSPNSLTSFSLWLRTLCCQMLLSTTFSIDYSTLIVESSRRGSP